VLRRVATIVVCASFLCAPAVGRRTSGHGAASRSASVWSAFGRWSFSSRARSQRQVAMLAARMRSVVPPGARVASGNFWEQSLLLSHHLGAHYWGVPPPDVSPERVRADLQANGIEYFWMWRMPKDFPVVAGWPRIPVPGFERFPLYRVPPSAPVSEPGGRATD
jgi:hypothetical protein